MIELINPYVVKILITARDGDSIRAISKRINVSYAWTYKWVEHLVALDVFKRKGQKIHIVTENRAYKKFMHFFADMLKDSLNLTDAYSLPHLAGLEYAFTSTDAIFIWTKGGYNIGRNKDRYPIFIEVLEEDIDGWYRFFSRFSIQATKKIEKNKGIYFIMMPKKTIEKEFVTGVFVIPLKTTIAYAQKYIYNFEPALEMLNDMYKLGMKISYAEKSI